MAITNRETVWQAKNKRCRGDIAYERIAYLKFFEYRGKL